MSRDINIRIGAAVRFSRTAMGLAIADIVEQLADPITIQQFARYENGKSRWPVDLLLDVANILQVDIKEICASEQTDNNERAEAAR